MVLEHCWSQVESAAAMIAICVSTYGPLLKGRSADTRIPSTSFKDTLSSNTGINPMQHPAHFKTKSTLAGPKVSSARQSNVLNRQDLFV